MVLEGKIVEVSTSHIRKEDGEKLLEHFKDSVVVPCIYPNEFGAFIVVPPQNEIEEMLGILTKEFGYSLVFANMMRFLADKGYDYIRLDESAGTHDELCTYDWDKVTDDCNKRMYRVYATRTEIVCFDVEASCKKEANDLVENNEVAVEWEEIDGTMRLVINGVDTRLLDESEIEVKN